MDHPQSITVEMDKDAQDHSGNILAINTLIDSKRDKFVVRKLINRGTFAIAYQVEDYYSDAQFAIKIYNHGHVFTKEALNEVKILEKLQKHPRFVKMYYDFILNDHFCIIQELLCNNLYDAMKVTDFRGYNHSIIKILAEQILEALQFLKMLGITHGDLKPENICIGNYIDGNLQVKIIDFGSSFRQAGRNRFYVQSRFYRAPETILGLKYGTNIDLWSFACILFELFTGNPLFPGKNSKEQILRHIKLLGMPSQKILCTSRFLSQFFHKDLMKTIPYLDYEKKTNRLCLLFKENTDIESFLGWESFEQKIFQRSKSEEENRHLIDFISKILKIDPDERASINDLIEHAYLSVSKLSIEYAPEKHRQYNKKGFTRRTYRSNIVQKASLIHLEKLNEKNVRLKKSTQPDQLTDKEKYK